MSPNNKRLKLDNGRAKICAFEAIVGHRDSKSENKLEVQIKWENGERTWEPMDKIKDDDPVTLVEYARAKNLLEGPAWKWAVEYYRIDSGSEDELFGEDDENQIVVDEKLDVDEQLEFVFPIPPPKLKVPRHCTPKSACRYDGPGIQVMRTEQKREQYFLNWYFQDRLMIREELLNGEKPCVDKIISAYDKDFTLVVSKLVKNKHGKSKYKGYEPKFVKCYYVAGSGPGLKKELNKLGDFGDMEPSKIASRLELMVSPAAWSHDKGYPLQFEMEWNDFEEIAEEGNVGCGYAPESVFVNLLGQNEGKVVSAIQVRIIGPRVGWAKGMLFKKPGISSIQLPPSMMKVKASLDDKAPGWVFFLVHSMFPSAPCKMMGRHWNPHLKDPPTLYAKGFTKMVPGDMYWSLLVRNGVTDAVLEQYAVESMKWERRNHYSVSTVLECLLLQ
jgi:hypothetical protein